MDIDKYFESVRELAKVANETGAQVHELIENPRQHKALVSASINFRISLLSSEEENGLSGYLAIGFFTGRPRRERLAAFAMTFEVGHEATRLNVEKQCQRYDRTQLLFQNVPSLYDKIRQRENGSRDCELIDVKAVSSVFGSEIYSAGSGFTKLSPFLSPGIINWAQKEWSSAPIFVRLDADVFATAQPPQLLTEATLVPANPRWLKNFSLRRGMKDFASYALQDRPVSAGTAEYWDYHVRHLRRLEIHVERREEKYLSMMIEELPRVDDPNGLMIGRCIHLDTRDPALTSLGQVQMQHLDLAINVYAGDDRRKRFDQSLQNGKVQNATFRTHLFRIEDTPFVSLFTFCEMFLKSKILLSEWLNELGAS
ncbi:hypothetical protein [Actibacterium sp. D379-3]